MTSKFAQESYITQERVDAMLLLYVSFDPNLNSKPEVHNPLIIFLYSLIAPKIYKLKNIPGGV